MISDSISTLWCSFGTHGLGGSKAALRPEWLVIQQLWNMEVLTEHPG